jgi:hypothetical protein
LVQGHPRHKNFSAQLLIADSVPPRRVDGGGGTRQATLKKPGCISLQLEGLYRETQQAQCPLCPVKTLADTKQKYLNEHLGSGMTSPQFQHDLTSRAKIARATSRTALTLLPHVHWT